MDYKHVEEILEKGEQELPAPYGKARLDSPPQSSDVSEAAVSPSKEEPSVKPVVGQFE